MKKIAASVLAVSLMTALCLNVSAADLTSGKSDSTGSNTASTDTATDTTTTATDSASTDTDDTALQDARAAYRTAKQNEKLSEFEDELKEMVSAGQLTQDQADLLLEAAKDDGTTGLLHGAYGHGRYSGKDDTADTDTDSAAADDTDADADTDTENTAAADDTTDDTALEEAIEAYRTAKAENELADYEAELKDMVTAGELTQDQADVLLEAAKNGEAGTGHHGDKGYFVSGKDDGDEDDSTADADTDTDADDDAADDSASAGSHSANGRGVKR